MSLITTTLGWKIEVESPVRAWVNGKPVKCGHRHRTVKGMHDCVVRRMSRGDYDDLRGRGRYSEQPLRGLGKPLPTRNEPLTVPRLIELLEQQGLKVQTFVANEVSALAKRRNHNMDCQPGDQIISTQGSVDLDVIVRAINGA